MPNSEGFQKTGSNPTDLAGFPDSRPAIGNGLQTDGHLLNRQPCEHVCNAGGVGKKGPKKLENGTRK